MHIVIDIPNTIWNKAKEYGHLDICGIELSKIVMNGTSLPEGHGRLIDVDEIPIYCDYYDVDNAPTAVEKDYGSLEEKYFGNPIDKTGIYADDEVKSEE